MSKSSFGKNLISIVVVIAIAYVLVDMFIIQKFQDKKNKENNKKECLKELNRNINGVVSAAYYDDNINVKAFVIYFTNGEKYINPFFLKSLNGSIKEGDSISKISGMFKFEIFKKENKKPMIIEETVDCDHLSK